MTFALFARCALCLMAITSTSCGGGSTSGPAGGGTVTGIGPAGGTVHSVDGRATLVIPAGALATTVDVTIMDGGSVPLDPAIVGGSRYVIAPATVTFAVPATLRIRYTDGLALAGVPESELQLATRAGGAASWVVQPTTLSTAGDSVIGAISAAATVSVRWPGPSAACVGAIYQQFDFWVGNWAYTAPNSFNGTDIVQKQANGCLLREDFVDVSGSVGVSLTLYDPVTAQWYQTYIDNRGGRLVLVGTLVGSTMYLYERPNSRFGWQLLSPGVVRYFGEARTGAASPWAVTFDARYTGP